MFLRSRNPLPTFLLSYHVWVTLKIQVNFRFSGDWWFCLIIVLNFSTIYVFEVEESIADIPNELISLVDLKNPGQLLVQEVLRGTDDSVLWNFIISQLYMFSRARNPFLTFLLSYLLWVTSETSSTGSWLRFSRSPEHGSSVGISAMYSLTSKT